MSIAKLFSIIALASSAVQFRSIKFNSSILRSELFSVLALVASALEVVLMFRLFRLPIPHHNTIMITSGVFVVSGFMIFKKASSGINIAAATLLMFIGAVQLLNAFRVIRGL